MIQGMSSRQPVTGGSTGAFGEMFAARMRSLETRRSLVERVLEEDGAAIADELFAVICKHVKAKNEIIIRSVHVDRTRMPQEMLDGTGRIQYTDRAVVEAMPRGNGDTVDVAFFRLGRTVGDEQLEKEYELRGLTAADPYSLAAVNDADPAFADEYPNATHWKNTPGKWCFVDFNRWLDERGVDVDCRSRMWRGSWWFAGVRN